MSISLQEKDSISQISQTDHKIMANQGLDDKISFRSINDFFLFPFYDELLQTIKLNPIFPLILALCLILQAFKGFLSFADNGITDFISDFYFSKYYETFLFPILYFLFEVFYFIYIIIQYRFKRMFNYRQLYLSVLILNFFNVIFYLPTCGVCGYSVVRLNQIFEDEKSYKNSDGIQNYGYKKFFVLANLSNNFVNFYNEGKKKSTNFIYKETSINFTDDLKINNSIQTNNFKNNNSDNNNNKIYLGDNYNHFKAPKAKSKIRQNYQNIIHDGKNKNKRKNIKNFKNVKLKYNNDDKSNFNEIIDNYQIHINSEYDDPLEEFINEDEPDEQSYIFRTEFIKYTFSLIGSLIQIIIFTIQITYNFHFVSESPYLDRTIFAMWDCKVFISYIFLMGIGQFFSQMLTILPSWCSICYHFFILFFDVYLMYFTFFQPFIKIGMNSFFQALFSYNFVFHFVLILWGINQRKFYIHIAHYISLTLILFFIIYYIINKKIIDKVNNVLTPPLIQNNCIDNDDNLIFNNQTLKKSKKSKRNKSELKQYYEMTDFEKREVYEKLVFRSIEHAFLYFRVGVSRSSPLLVDFSFIKYMKETYNQIQIQLFILRITSLFPSYLHYLSSWLAIMAKNEEVMSVYNQFIMFQLHRINNSRQSSFSKEIQKELFALEKQSDEAISAIRSFWAEEVQSKTDLKISTLDFIRELSLRTKTYYIDAIEKYPNSSQILNSYCRFLIECCGDYIECARIGQRIRLIEQGKYVNSDFCFRSFVNVFPQYLKMRIVNERGSFMIDNNGESSSFQSSTSISAGRTSASFDNIVIGMQSDNVVSNDNYSIGYYRKKTDENFQHMIEEENFDALISTLFNNGKARLSIQQIVYKSHSTALIMSAAVAIVQTIFFLFIMCLEFGFISHYAIPIQLIESSSRTSKIIFSLQYCSLVAGVQYLAENYKVNISQKIIEFMNINHENLPKFPCTFIKPMVSLSQMAMDISNLIDNEMKFLLKNTKDHINEIKMYNDLDVNVTYTYSDERNDDRPIITDTLWGNGVFIYNFKNMSYTIYKVTLRNGLEHFRALSNRLIYEIASYTRKTNERDMSIFNDLYIELLVNGLTISEPFFHLFKIISENGINLIEKNEILLKNIFILVFVIGTIVFTVLRFICFYKIKKFIEIMANIVNNVRDEDKIETLEPIYIKSNRAIKVHSANNHSIYESSSPVLFYPLVTLFTIFNVMGIFSISIFQINSSFSYIKSAQHWENDGAARFLYLGKMINCVIAEHLSIPNFTISEKLKLNSKELLNLSQNLDLSIIGKGKELDEYYFLVNEEATINSRNKNSRQSMNKKKIKNKFNSKGLQKVKGIRSTFDSNNNNSTSVRCIDLDTSMPLTLINLATFLDCISIENKINLGILYYHLLENSIKNDILVNTPEFITSLFILDKYLYRDLPGFQDKVSETTISEVDKRKRNVYIIGSFAMLISLIFSFIEFLTIKKIYYSYYALKQLILILPPSAFANNSVLVDFLINSCSPFGYNVFTQKIDLIKKVLSEEEILVNSVDSGVVIIDKNLIIQLVNPALQKMTGFPSDQLLGQHLQHLIPHTSKHAESNVSFEKYPFYQRLNEIMQGNGNISAELNAKVSTDKGNEIVVRATIIGIYDMKVKSHQKNIKYEKKKRKVIIDSDTSSSSSSDEDNNNNNETQNSNVNDNKFNDCLFCSIILKDISKENELKKKLKESKYKSEALLNFLLPQPVLERIRATKEPVYYDTKQATVIIIEICGFNQYIGTMGPKAMMTSLQVIYNEINQIHKRNSLIDRVLFDRAEAEKKNDKKLTFKSIFHKPVNTFQYNLDSVDDDAIEITKSFKNFNSKSAKNLFDDIDDVDDGDENCDFECVYNIRNDNDQIISISGLFDTQDDPKKQAESCLRYAFKVKNVIKKIEHEEQANWFIHTRIVVCMGGPMAGFVENYENPQIQIFSNLLNDADEIKNMCGLDDVCINENVYDNIDKENYEIEEILVPIINQKVQNKNKMKTQKNYSVHSCLKKKRKEKLETQNAYEISTDSEN